MPFVQIYRRPERVDAVRALSIARTSCTSLATALMRYDSAHVVRPAMVDVKVLDIGELDIIRCDLFVSCFARTEPARHAHRREIVDAVRTALLSVGLGPDDVVELLLTDHTSSFDYSRLE